MIPNEKGAPLQDAPLCPLLVSLSKSPELLGRFRGLSHGLPFQALNGVCVMIPADHPSDRKINSDDLAHLSVLKSGKPVWPVSVHHQ